MRIVLALAICLVACTKQNPNLCCIDEADCANVGLEEVKGCSDGLLCRGNQCIAEVCASSQECDADAPFCVFVPDGRCQMECTEDAQCPGFGGTADQTFCEAGACVACRVDANDCDVATPVCNAGQCVGCTRNDQCGSGVCVEDGTCATEGSIAYVATTGSPTADCTATGPCSTIAAALALLPARPFIVIEAGTYSSATTIGLAGSRRLIGRGTAAPIIRRTTNGPIITLGNGTFGLEFLDVAGAQGGGNEDDTGGFGVMCPTNNNTTLRLVESTLRENASRGLQIRRCSVTALNSKFIQNGAGINSTDSTLTLDGCTVSNNMQGLSLDAGVFQLTNNFIVRNQTSGINLFLFGAETARIEFNTIVDNGAAFANCTPNGPYANNILARNANNSVGACSFPNSVIINDVGPLNFVSPDVTPFDYHIKAGSIAIDAGTITTLDHDFDGQPRPSDEPDVGADEL